MVFGYVNASVGKTAMVVGKVVGKPFTVASATLYYFRNVIINVYLGSAESKNAWSWLSGRLTQVSGLTVEVTPQAFVLDPNQTAVFSIHVKPEKPGEYHLYIVAFGGRWMEGLE